VKAVELEPYTREELGFAISFPPDSEVVEDVQGAAVVAIAPPGDGDFRPNLNVVVERLDPPLELEAYLERSLEIEQRMLSGHQLLDRVSEALGGVPGLRTLAHHDVGGQAVVLEQWRALAGEAAFVVSASCGALDYHAVADLFARCAESFRVLEAPGSR